jgi:asparagine synthase (glutamine-hydrolysing)
LRRELFGATECAALLPGVKHYGIPEPNTSAVGDSVNAVTQLELEVYARNVLLRDSDSMSMAHSVELRVPFLDREIVETVARHPGTSKLGPPPKRLLVESVRDLLPTEVVDRRKMGFTLPFDYWLRHDLRGRVEETLLSDAPGRGLLETRSVAAVWARFQDGQVNWLRPWALNVLTTWIDRNLGSADA